MALIKYDPQKQKRPLWDEILKFSKNKYLLAIILILIGLTGFIIPVIPGILLIVMAVALLRKGTMKALRDRFRRNK